MDTLEWGRHFDDDLDLEDADNSAFDHMYSDNNTYSSSLFDDFSSGFQPPLFSFENVIPVKEEHHYGQSNSYYNTPSIPIKQEFYTAPPPFTYSGNSNNIIISEPPIKNEKKSLHSHKRQHCEVSEDSSTELDIRIENQPPVEVRTRTPSEIRTFSVSAKVLGKFRSLEASIMKVILCYAPSTSGPAELVVSANKKEILGGTKTVALLPDGTAIFDNLWISESSTKHKEREFCLEFVLLKSDGNELLRKCSKPFYAYSHKKVLQRRGNVKLRTLSKTYGRISGGEQMHVIGTPFIQGPALSLLFRTPHGEVPVNNLEYYSDSVLFFELPPYPLPEGVLVNPDTEIKVTMLLTNDGRTFSNPLEFTYLADNTPRSRI